MAKYTVTTCYLKLSRLHDELEEAKQFYSDKVVSSLERDYFKNGAYNRKAPMSSLSKLEIGIALKKVIKIYGEYRSMNILYKKLKEERSTI